eukprot:m.1211742 g.1211742  ORF g.1211742 m.1211742 type:complete len:186 (-) comp24594_c0_seq6:249-806(-)
MDNLVDVMLLRIQDKRKSMRFIASDNGEKGGGIAAARKAAAAADGSPAAGGEKKFAKKKKGKKKKKIDPRTLYKNAPKPPPKHFSEENGILIKNPVNALPIPLPLMKPKKKLKPPRPVILFGTYSERLSRAFATSVSPPGIVRVITVCLVCCLWSLLVRTPTAVSRVQFTHSAVLNPKSSNLTRI